MLYFARKTRSRRQRKQKDSVIVLFQRSDTRSDDRETRKKTRNFPTRETTVLSTALHTVKVNDQVAALEVQV